MRSGTDRIFFKSGLRYFLVLVFTTLIFLIILGLQLLSVSITTFYYLGVTLMFLSFLMNIALDKFGFYASFVLNFLQFLAYAYEYLVMDNGAAPVMMAMTFTVMTMDLFLQYYIIRMANKIYEDWKTNRKERNARIAKELEEEMFSRTSLIVNHEEMDKKNENISEALGESLASSIDPLTTLPGREMITARMDRHIADDVATMQSAKTPDAQCHPFSVIYVGLDGYEDLSREIGYKSMDLFIQNMAHRVREAALPSDMVARLVNAEFIVLSRRSMSDLESDAYARKLATSCMKAFESGSDKLSVSVSCGVANYPRDGRIAGELIAKAEEARLAVRDTEHGKVGKISMTKYADMAKVMERAGKLFEGKTQHEITSIFESAIEDGSLHMIYQPCFTQDRTLLGFEAFMRFEHGKDLIPPQVFLSAAENADYINRIGGFSIDQSLKALALFDANRPGLTMNLNISTSQLKNPGFINMLSNAVSNADCKLMNLILDIPEEGLFTELPDIKEAIEKLSAKGVKMALDNFGRGYSSFNAIPLLPITVLKLDGNFTGNLASDANVRVLSASVISLMHDIDIKVCATGVGSDEQFRILAEQGCDIFQGKYLGPAMTLEEALDSIS